MEAVIMKDIMNMATLLIRNPKSIKKFCLELFKENNSNDDITTLKPNLVSLKNKLDEVDGEFVKKQQFKKATRV